jgi:FkbM family methyltransferase
MQRLGLDLELDLRDGAQYFVYREGAYEPHLSERIMRELRPSDVYVDVGAHIGIHALVAARQLERLGGGHVYAFEPATDTASRLATAVERNGINNLTLVRAALGESPGQLELRAGGPFGADHPGMRSVVGPGRVVHVVPVVRFDDWVAIAGLSHLDLVKLDVEGGELAALVGMRDSLARLSPRQLFVEANPVTLHRVGVTWDQVVAEVARSGYVAIETIRDHETVENVVFARKA